MKAVIISKQAPRGPVTPNVRVVTDWPEPDPPGPAEALIRVEASALNHMDLWVGMGLLGVEIEYPHIGGCDACGTVEAVGEGVDEAWVGRRVIFNAAVDIGDLDRPDDPPDPDRKPNWNLIGEHSKGAHREKFLCPVANLAAVDDMGAIESAAFGLTCLTAWSMMITKGALRPGQSVLITGIGGGVSTAALAIAAWLGCPAIVTSRHEWKLEKARAMGAAEGVLDDSGDWSRQVRALTNKRGVDMAVDTVGKATHLSCIKSLARGGRYVTAGATTGPDATTDLARIFWNQLKILGSTMGSNAEFREIAALFRAGHLKPVVDSSHNVDDAPAAYDRLERGDQMGKIVLKWN